MERTTVKTKTCKDMSRWMSYCCHLLNFSLFMSLGYDITYYFIGRMGFVQYVKNNFLQKLGEFLCNTEMWEIDAKFKMQSSFLCCFKVVRSGIKQLHWFTCGKFSVLLSHIKNIRFMIVCLLARGVHPGCASRGGASIGRVYPGGCIH